MTEPTARQLAVEAAVERHGGRQAVGAQSKAARELGVSNGAIHSALKALDEHRSPTRAAKVRRPRLAREIIDALPSRLDTIDAQSAVLLEAIIRLERKVDGFVGRQPVLLEVRPRHERRADGGLGGHREVKSAPRAISGRQAAEVVA